MADRQGQALDAAAVKEHPQLGGKTLAVVQCNKIISKRQLYPLPDRTVGKDFDTGKKEESPSLIGLRSTVSRMGPQLPYHLDMANQQPLTSSAVCALGDYGGEDFVLPPPTQSASQSLIENVDINSASQQDDVYSRGVTPPSGTWNSTMKINKIMEVASTSATHWCEVGDPQAALQCLNMNEGNPTLSNYSTHYSHKQNLHLEENKKSMLPGQGSGAPVAALTASPPPQLSSSQLQPQHSGRVSCDYPNCTEALLLGMSRKHPTKNMIHRCYMPGCGKVYKSPYLLSEHVRSHKDEHPFVCNLPNCEKSFIRLRALQNHQRNHAGEKRFACYVCNSLFKSSEALLYHMKTQHISNDDKETVCSSDTCSDSENSESNSPKVGSPSTQGPSQVVWQPWLS